MALPERSAAELSGEASWPSPATAGFGGESRSGHFRQVGELQCSAPEVRMPAFVFRFGYESPIERVVNARDGTDFESSRS
jgi:hypothetical protein